VCITGPDSAIAATDNDEPADLELTWRRVLTCPQPAITFEAFRSHAEGGRFPDVIPGSSPFPADHNKPSDEDAAYRELTAKADAILARVGAIVTDGTKADVDLAAGIAKELAELASEVEKAHAAEKRPWLEGGRQVDDRWSFAKTLREAAADIKRKVVTPILAERQRAAEAEARARAEEERKRREEEFRASRPKPGEAPPPPPPVEAPAPVSAGSGGKSLKLKSVEVATVTDALAFCEWLLGQKNADLADCLNKQAAKLLRAGIKNAAGVTITTEQVAK